MDRMEVICMFDLNLAPIKYLNILKKDGGPVQEIHLEKCKIEPEKEGFLACAYLSEEIVNSLNIICENKIYGKSQGCGSSIYKNIAVYKAISETLERWAFWKISRSPTASVYGFDIDWSTSGMAAFPGLTNYVVKKAAYYEAVERWSMLEWWFENLGIKNVSQDNQKTYTAIELDIPFDDCVCVILHRKLSIGLNIYGFACHKSFKKAVRKAECELQRNQDVMEKEYGNITHNLHSLVSEQIRLLPEILEKRLLFFSTEDGYKLFKNKLEKGMAAKKKMKKPTLLINKEIQGAWSKYATVWRIIYENSFKLENKYSINIFRF